MGLDDERQCLGGVSFSSGFGLEVVLAEVGILEVIDLYGRVVFGAQRYLRTDVGSVHVV